MFLKRSNSSTSSPFTAMFSLFLAISDLSALHFLALNLRPTLAASSINLPIFSRKSLNLDDSSAISSTKSRSFNTVVKFHLIPLLLCAVVFLMIQAMASKNKNSDNTHPYFTPDLTLNQSDISHPLVTAHSNPSYVSIITPTILRGIP